MVLVARRIHVYHFAFWVRMTAVLGRNCRSGCAAERATQYCAVAPREFRAEQGAEGTAKPSTEHGVSV
jgi:hypothetical protein